jgi:ERF superfamily protein
VADSVPAVYAKIAAVSAELAQVGISKGRRNQQQGYSFRGIDDVLNALAPMLANHGLVILPRCLSRTSTERETKTGGTLFYSVVEAAFDFVAAVDGSVHTAVTFGEAMDSADKSTNKAMSAAYKYAAILAFCIPVVGEDADATTHEVAPRSTPVTRPVTPQQTATETHSAPEGEGWVKVLNVKVGKKGTSNKGPWTLWIVNLSDGREVSTFDDALAEKASDAKRRNVTIRPAVQAKGDKLSLTNIYAVSA